MEHRMKLYFELVRIEYKTVQHRLGTLCTRHNGKDFTLLKVQLGRYSLSLVSNALGVRAKWTNCHFPLLTFPLP